MPNDYITAVIRAGALPVLLPLTDNQPVWDAMVDSFDAMILPGARTLSHRCMARKYCPPAARSYLSATGRNCTHFGRLLASGKPFLAICRGIQLVNVFAGGTLYQDIASQMGTEINHAQFDIGSGHIHTVQRRASSGPWQAKRPWREQPSSSGSQSPGQWAESDRDIAGWVD